MSIPVLTPEAFLKAQAAARKAFHDDYLVMYSSLWKAFVTDPTLWTVPADDHMVHRGDAVFEVFKCEDGRVYSFEAHLERLRRSAEAIGLALPPEFAEARSIIRELLHLGGHKNAQFRLTVSRGPGGFSSNPYECPESLMIVTSSKLKLPAPEKYAAGVSLITSPIMAKAPFYAGIKSCAYLQNVLVKKSAVDAGADFAVCFDHDGFLAEGSTENVAIITKKRELTVPAWRRILRGTTLTRLMELGEGMVRDGLLSAVLNRDLTEAEAKAEAAEVIVCSTTMNMMSVVSWDGRPVGDGRPGPLAAELYRRLKHDMAVNDAISVPMFD